MSLKVHFRTFGCKLNQLETESLASAFCAAGASAEADSIASASPADIYVFNTCTVTGKAEQKARREIRLASRRNPAALILVTGCYAQMEAETVVALAPRVVVVPGEFKDSLLTVAETLSSAAADHIDLYDHAQSLFSTVRSVPADPFAFAPESFSFHSRPSLKIQDGCNNRCTYCRVCLARGKSVSLNPELALQRVLELEQQGAPEIVLTGVNLSQYRHGDMDFCALVHKLINGTKKLQFRISSWEPDRIDAAFLELFANPRVQPHLHLAVQSGSDRILSAMGRRYTARAVLTAVERLKSLRADPFLGADLICGFPGENEADFKATMQLAEQAGFAWLHAFTFSARPGTPAAAMPNQTDSSIAGQRTAELNRLALRLRQDFAGRRRGTILQAVLERTDENTANDNDTAVWRSAVSDDYLKLAVRNAGQELNGRIQLLVDTETTAKLPPGHDLSAIAL
ncbi:MAG: tRNA (N(6)-L-threonylcarbamoyladenosine(37)-C(2))-methylthiotransferase MtaB [Spirochaetes bacterium]|nr:tRNA (N(6)-L-threonylcarbamoyladenosine(37)-C(2))-methylthiotransferase MtaB [Spirochaetota bacterium]MBU0956906.1 tRNA (N(6)-L-threonylcarbamoyladenosine(37)-C(2))-methylthiotransferase MtaB [Spirochaetota bacterium]